MMTNIIGKTVVYEEDAKQGVDYLKRMIDSHEAKVFFDQAFSRGSASFEDRMGYNYKLSLHGAEYLLEKKEY